MNLKKWTYLIFPSFLLLLLLLLFLFLPIAYLNSKKNLAPQKLVDFVNNFLAESDNIFHDNSNNYKLNRVNSSDIKSNNNWKNINIKFYIYTGVKNEKVIEKLNNMSFSSDGYGNFSNAIFYANFSSEINFMPGILSNYSMNNKNFTLKLSSFGSNYNDSGLIYSNSQNNTKDLLFDRENDLTSILKFGYYINTEEATISIDNIKYNFIGAGTDFSKTSQINNVSTIINKNIIDPNNIKDSNTTLVYNFLPTTKIIRKFTGKLVPHDYYLIIFSYSKIIDAHQSNFMVMYAIRKDDYPISITNISDFQFNFTSNLA